MSYDFALERFDPSGQTLPKHPRVLDDILAAIEKAIPAGSNRHRVWKRGRKTIEVQLASGLGVIHPDHAAFNVHDFDHDADLQVLYAIAKAGDMVVTTEGNTHILSSPAQRQYLPDYGFEYDVHLARDWKGLARLLREDADPAALYQKEVPARYESITNPGGNPPNGTRKRPVVYVQPRHGETVLDHLDRLFACVDTFAAGRGGRRITGTIGGTAWSLRTPTGQCFVGCSVTGDIRDWMRFFKAHSAAERSRHGRITPGGRKFRLDDGRVYPMSKCILRQVGDDDVVR